MNDVATPLVSIVIVTYNQQAYIAEAIEGALGQDHPKLEIIVSDDASSDGTWAIVDAYAQRYPEVVGAWLQECRSYRQLQPRSRSCLWQVHLLAGWRRYLFGE